MFKPCIFCREDATRSQSCEHIIPESLGNTKHILPPGVVCDRCNNYFARKIEGPLLNTPYFRHARATMQVANRRNRIPPQLGFLPQLRLSVDVWLDGSSITLDPHDKSRRGDFERLLLSRKNGSLWLPIPTELDQRLMSRFLGKVAIEALAQQLSGTRGWREEILDQDAMEPLRRYVRVGDLRDAWKFTRRRLYPAEQSFGIGCECYQILHEFDFLYTEDRKLIFVLGLFGEEFSINMGGSDNAHYEAYLQTNQGKSLLAPRL